ncbi:MAG: c-type cytochrome [Acidiferrobacterales bacterium]|nr:c-type cytochrome [Acidiferrobacterales bacterium]
MSHISDGEFWKRFSMLVGALVALTFVLFVLAQIMGSMVNKEPSPQAKAADKALAERIKPVGQLRVAGGPGEKMINTLVPAANAAAGGESTYKNSCAVCHAAGVAGAPKFSDKAAWKDRIAKGKDTLYEHAIKGFQGKVGFMPAKGGNAALPDEDVKAAVDYMVNAAQ